MKHYIYISLLFICISINAQVNVRTKIKDVDSTFLPKLTGDFFYEGKMYIGEQYYNKDWMTGDILLSTGAMVYDKSLKYNGLFDELIWLNGTNFTKIKIDKPIVSEFWLKNDPYSIIHFKQINLSEPGNVKQKDVFAELRVEGSFSLFVQRKISIIGTQLDYINNVVCQYDVITATPIYYIKLPSNQYLKLNKLRRRSFLKFFPDKKKNITKIIRTNNLDVSEESDFVRLIELMNNDKTL
jgi:hypothetical protein